MRFPFKLKEYFVPRVLPIMIIFVLLLSTVAPGMYFYLKVDEARSQGEAVAAEAANFLRHEVHASPGLWKYDTIKLLGHVEVFSVRPSLAGILIEDEKGGIINVDDEAELRKYDSPFITWSMAPLIIDNKLYGKVFAGIDIRGPRKRSLLLLAAFFAVGLLLSGGITFYFTRLAGRAQKEIEGLFEEAREARRQVEHLNRNLEGEVAAKTGELKEAYEKIKASREDLARISARSMLLEEEEKKAVARDLHDSLGQAVTAMRIDLEMLDKEDADPEERRRILARCTRIADEALDELRHVVETMRPPMLDYAGLRGAMEKLVERFEERIGAEVKRRIEVPDEADIPPAVEIACYRIVQEALTNILRHASAGRVEIDVAASDGRLLVDIRDDGKGFDVREAGGMQSGGIRGARERAEILGGSAVWESRRGEGCRLRVEIPFPGPGRGGER